LAIILAVYGAPEYDWPSGGSDD